MTTAELFTEYLEHLFGGKRCEARELIYNAHDRGIGAEKLLKSIIWPAMEQVEKLYREHHISRIVEQMATRINRMIADQIAALLARKPKTGQRMVICCGEGEIEELGAQITGDLFELHGWSVWFIGAGAPNDEVMTFAGKIRPDVLCIYGARPSSVPGIRKLIETVRSVGACSEMQILVTGGVFNRAEGLADEVKADLFAATASDAVSVVNEHPFRVPKPDMPEPGRRRKRRRNVTTPMRQVAAV